MWESRVGDDQSLAVVVVVWWGTGADAGARVGSMWGFCEGT